MWKYSVIKRKWECLSLKLPAKLCDFSHFITTNERFIIFSVFVGGDDGLYYIDLEAEELEFVISPLNNREVSDNPDGMIMTGNLPQTRVIVDGYTKLMDKNEDMFIPGDVKEIIARYYTEELVHFLAVDRKDDYESSMHWIVGITDIIPNYNTH